MLRRDSALPQGERNAMESPMKAWPSPPWYENSPTAIFVGMWQLLQPATTFQGNIGTHQTNRWCPTSIVQQGRSAIPSETIHGLQDLRPSRVSAVPIGPLLRECGVSERANKSCRSTS